MTAAHWAALPREDSARDLARVHDISGSTGRPESVDQVRAARADASPFTTVQARFDALSEAGVLAIPAAVLGRDDRPVTLAELRDLLLERTVSYEQRDRMLDQVLARARSQPDPWLLGVVGLLLPGLRRVRDRIEHDRAFAELQRHPAAQNELQIELVTALMEAACARTPGQPKVAQGLLTAAAAAGRRVARAEFAARDHANFDDLLADPETLGYHPIPDRGRSPLDVLRDAVKENVLHPHDAWLIAASRLERQPLPDLAQQLDIPYHTVRKRRERAEARLHAWLTTRPDAGGSASDATRRRSGSHGNAAQKGSGGRPRIEARRVEKAGGPADFADRRGRAALQPAPPSHRPADAARRAQDPRQEP